MTQTLYSIVNLTPTSIDRQGCNYYISGSTVIVETVEEYLSRIKIPLRAPGLIVTIIEAPGVYDINAFRDILNNHTVAYYRFIDGLTDDKFTKITLGLDIDPNDFPKAGSLNVNAGNSIIVFNKPFSDEFYEVQFTGQNALGRVDGKLINHDKDKFEIYMVDNCTVGWIAVKH